MAQKTEKEETKFKLDPHPSSSQWLSNIRNRLDPVHPRDLRRREMKPVETSNDLKKDDSDLADVVHVKREVNRCSGCRRKVGLTRFRVDVASFSAPIIVIPTGMIAVRTTRPPDDRPSQGKIRWLR
ncbi:zinc finger A20 and AN1 domain-containing stress-associated protein 5-like [Abeliophyllum distichum]|uniref:Zinc finger A20 and AN1 domain-containing stress-associated protein 5-like n=1 Tax=Abeliophyllum distichum TaxID=126358 RepID=A0ABD1U1F3_9LAMI